LLLSIGSVRDHRAARKPGRDSSRGVADERCSMRCRGKGLIRKRTTVAQSCRMGGSPGDQRSFADCCTSENQLSLQAETYKV